MFPYRTLKELGFVNADGFVTVEPYAHHIPGEGNGWLQTGVWACGAYPQGHSMIERIGIADLFQDMFRASRRSQECPLIWRSPHKRNPGDNQNHDDYWGALAISYLIGGEWAREIVAWGERRGWFFDIEEPESKRLRYYFGRFPDFVPFVRLCAGQKLSLSESIILAGTIIWDAFHISAADANMRAFCKVTVAERETILGNLAARLWKSRVRRRYGEIGMAWKEYFREGHPLNMYEDL